MITAIITLIVLPFLAPYIMDFMANALVSSMNRAIGKPTWTIGAKFKDIILPNSARLGPCFIYNMTWKHIILRDIRGSLNHEHGTIRIKKREMLRSTLIEIDRTIIR